MVEMLPGNKHGHDGCYIGPDGRQKNCFPNGNLFEEAKIGKGDLWCRIQKSEQGGEEKCKPMSAQFIKKNERSNNTGKIKQEVGILMFKGPPRSIGRTFGPRCQVPVKIITADGCKKDEQVIVPGNDQVQQMAALPGHQNCAKRNINTAEKKKINNFPNPDQGLSILIYNNGTGRYCIAMF